MMEKSSHGGEPQQPEEVSFEKKTEDKHIEEESYPNKNKSIERGWLDTVEDIFHGNVNEDHQIPFQNLTHLNSSEIHSDNKKGKLAEEDINHKSSIVESVGDKMKNIKQIRKEIIQKSKGIRKDTDVSEGKSSTNKSNQFLQLENLSGITRSMEIKGKQEGGEHSMEEDIQKNVDVPVKDHERGENKSKQILYTLVDIEKPENIDCKSQASSGDKMYSDFNLKSDLLVSNEDMPLEKNVASAELTDQALVTCNVQPISRVKSIDTKPETTAQSGVTADLKSKRSLEDERKDSPQKYRFSPILKADSKADICIRIRDDDKPLDTTKTESLKKIKFHLPKETEQTVLQECVLCRESSSSIEDVPVKNEENNLECRKQSEKYDAFTKLKNITPLRERVLLKEESVSPNKEIIFSKEHKSFNLEDDVFDGPHSSTVKNLPETGTFDVVSETLSIPKEIYLVKPTQDHSVQPIKQALKEIKKTSHLSKDLKEKDVRGEEEPILSETDSNTQKISKIVKHQDYESYVGGIPLKEETSPLMVQAFSKNHVSTRAKSISPNTDITLSNVLRSSYMEEGVHEDLENSTAESSFDRIHLKEAKSQPEIDTFGDNAVIKELSLPKVRYQMMSTQEKSVQPIKEAEKEIKKLANFAEDMKKRDFQVEEVPILSEADSKSPKIFQSSHPEDYESHKESIPLKKMPSPLISQTFSKEHGPVKGESVSLNKDIIFTNVHKSFHLEEDPHEGSESSTTEMSFKITHSKEEKSQPDLDSFGGSFFSKELNIPKERNQMKPTQDHAVQPMKQDLKEIKKSSTAGYLNKRSVPGKLDSMLLELESETHKDKKHLGKEAPFPLRIPALSNNDGSFILRVSDQKTEPLPHDENNKDIRNLEHNVSISGDIEMTKKPFEAKEQTERENSYLNKRYIQEEKSLQSEDEILTSKDTSDMPSILKCRDDLEEGDSTKAPKAFKTQMVDSEATFLKTAQFPCSERLTQDFEEPSLKDKEIMFKEKSIGKMDIVQQHEFTLPVAASLRGIRNRLACFLYQELL